MELFRGRAPWYMTEWFWATGLNLSLAAYLLKGTPMGKLLKAIILAAIIIVLAMFGADKLLRKMNH